MASANGYSKVVEFLLENHAAVDAVDKDLWTAAHAAACWGHVCIFGATIINKTSTKKKTSNILSEKILFFFVSFLICFRWKFLKCLQ